MTLISTLCVLQSPPHKERDFTEHAGKISLLKEFKCVLVLLVLSIGKFLLVLKKFQGQG
jgi:hypothetical protein